jgi:putative ABC transport system permease protein
MAVGGTIVTLLLYNSVVGRRHDFALVKAIGGSTSDLYSIVLWQAFVTSAFGAAAGIAGAAVLAPVLPYVVPELTVCLTPHVLALVALAAVTIAGTGALMPLRKLAGIDPEEVFRT